MLNDENITFISYAIENASVANEQELKQLRETIEALRDTLAKLEMIERSEAKFHKS
jgi:hypothetical protein